MSEQNLKEKGLYVSLLSSTNNSENQSETSEEEFNEKTVTDKKELIEIKKSKLNIVI